MIVRLLTRYYLGRRPACCGQRVLLNLVVYGIFVTVFVITFMSACIMKIYSLTGAVVIDTESVCLLSDSSEKTDLFTVRKHNNHYNCRVRGVVCSYRLVKATVDDSPDKTFNAYYLPYVRIKLQYVVDPYIPLKNFSV